LPNTKLGIYSAPEKSVPISTITGQAAEKSKKVEKIAPKRKFNFGSGGLKCPICSKTVYATEQIDYNKEAFHNTCFKVIGTPPVSDYRFRRCSVSL
jgi:hypothetical protein